MLPIRLLRIMSSLTFCDFILLVLTAESLDFTAYLADQNHQPIFKSATKRGCGLVTIHGNSFLAKAANFGFAFAALISLSRISPCRIASLATSRQSSRATGFL